MFERILESLRTAVQPESRRRDRILNVGLRLAMEFGEHWLQPIQPRLSKRYPDLSTDELEEYNRICQGAMRLGHDYIYKFAEENRTEPSADDFKTAISSRYPWVNRANLSRLRSQGHYYAWKDGLIT